MVITYNLLGLIVPLPRGCRNMPDNRSPGRAGSPISLYPLTPEQALRRAMSAPVPKSEPKPPKAVKKHPAKKAVKKSGK